MSAVLAITDRRSALFQILFTVFDSLEGFVIVMVHCILRREVSALTVAAHTSHMCIGVPRQELTSVCFQVQEAVKCRVEDHKDDGNGDSGSSQQNGHTQLMVSTLERRVSPLLTVLNVIQTLTSCCFCFGLSLILRRTLTQTGQVSTQTT